MSADEGEDAVVARAVVKRFQGQTVLKGVSLRVRQGQVTCLIGPSGSGKSTFLRCVDHLDQIDAGELLVAGEHVGYRRRGGRLFALPERSFAARRSDIGMVFQQFNLFAHMTALQNVMEAPIHVRHEPRAKVARRARELLAQVGLSDKADVYPEHLSGGQQQRVAIARALAMRPRLMLFDEPTSALDPEMVGEVLEVIRRLAARGMTMLIVTHEFGFAREIADSAAFMEDGRIVESGSADQIFAHPRVERTAQFVSRGL